MIINPRTQKARARAQAAVNRRQALLETSFSKQVKRVLDAQRRVAANAVATGKDPYKAIDAYKPQLAAVYAKEYRRIAQSFLTMTQQSLADAKAGDAPAERKGVMAEIFWQMFADYTRKVVAKKVVQVTNTTKEMIRGIVELGTAEGLSWGEIAKEIWESSGSDINTKRAKRIARTEVHGASTFSMQAAVESTGLEMSREWIAMADERTRSSHRAAHGQVRAMDEPFDVGGEELDFPGDPKGEAGNVINCRCVLIYHTGRSASDRTTQRRREQRQYRGMENAWE